MSGWMMGFTLEGLYSAASEVNQGPIPIGLAAAAAQYCHDSVVNDGLNSWLGMIRQNATMTMESWVQPPCDDGCGDGGTGGGTFSHPWTAAPAWIVPRFLMGIRPGSDGWRTISIRPMPSITLRAASIAILTPRGRVALSFTSNTSTFDVRITVPGNTNADVCLPRYLFGEGAECTATLDGSQARSEPLGALQCFSQAVGGGDHAASIAC